MNVAVVNGILIHIGLIAIAIKFPWFWVVLIPLNLVLTFPQWLVKKKPPEPKD